MKVLFLGPCYKKNPQTGLAHPAFDPATPSGKYVALVQKTLNSVACEFYSSNVIDRPFLCPSAREEVNPTAEDLLREWGRFEQRLQKIAPDCVVAFGSNVRGAFSLVDGISYTCGDIYQRGQRKIIFAPHPSFVMIYKRKRMSHYARSLSRLIADGATLGQNFCDANGGQAV